MVSTPRGFRRRKPRGRELETRLAVFDVFVRNLFRQAQFQAQVATNGVQFRFLPVHILTRGLAKWRSRKL
jgi:hypothetical protein